MPRATGRTSNGALLSMSGSMKEPAIPAFMASSLGTRLRALSKETGHTSRTATSPHRRQLIHLGAFFSSGRKMITAAMSQLAAMLMLHSLVKIAAILTPPSRRQ